MAGFDPLQSLAQVAQISGLIRRTRMEEEESKRRAAREDYERSIQERDAYNADQDFVARMALTPGVRQVSNGLVEEMLAPPAVAGVSPEVAQQAARPVMRKAKPGQTVSRKLASGKTVSFELPTPEEAQAYEIERQRELSRVQSEAELETEGVPIGGMAAELLGIKPGTPVRLSELDEATRAAVALESIRQPAQQEPVKLVSETDDQGNVHWFNPYTGERVRSERGAGKSRASTAQETPAQKEATYQAHQRQEQQQVIQRERRSQAERLSQEERELDEQQTRYWQYARNIPEGDTFAYIGEKGQPQEQKMTKEFRAALEQSIKNNERKILDIARRKARAVYGERLQAATKADLEAYARARGIGLVEAERRFLADGYEVR